MKTTDLLRLHNSPSRLGVTVTSSGLERYQICTNGVFLIFPLYLRLYPSHQLSICHPTMLLRGCLWTPLIYEASNIDVAMVERCKVFHYAPEQRIPT
ncbi:hypothetical protein OCU04_002349 [Sclerotinia nivalis]|uniref:Uncharacterized protein n=1 Tax=Sclerotinia nivalis TaxID=352851 RepID=A0A9X0ATF6_9HELO|nr:hypothetical protein OCU04_002349 [Sclerotinia nivalis]